jgi:uncharacterized membrane protein
MRRPQTQRVSTSAAASRSGQQRRKLMNATTLGLTSGIALGLAAAFGGFGAFLTVLVLGALGLLAGRMAEGKLDLSQLTNRNQG